MMRLFISLFALLASFSVLAAPVNINSADAKTIADSLSGIGMKKAEAIVKYRTEKGLFKSADDLVNVSGIGPKTVAKIKKDILLGDGAAPAEPAAAATAAPAAAPAVAPAPAAASPAATKVEAPKAEKK